VNSALETNFARKVETRGEHLAAVAKLINGQAIKEVECKPADAASTDNLIKIDKQSWDAIRDLCSAHGTRIPEDRVALSNQEARQLAALLRTRVRPQAGQHPLRVRTAIDKLLAVINQGGGLSVRGVKP